MTVSLGSRRRSSVVDVASWELASGSPKVLHWVDVALIAIFLAGLYTNFTIMVSQKVPFPSIPSGIAGLLLFWRRRDSITPRALAGLLAILLMF
jgi:hypothetical protein